MKTTIKAGDTVTWHNSGPSRHSATATDKSFDTGVLARGGSGSHTFTAAGTFTYYCSVHPSMHGTVTVLTATPSGKAGNPTTGTSPETSSSGSRSGSSPSSNTSSRSSSPSAGASSGSGGGRGGSLASTGLDVGLLTLLGVGLLCLGSGLRLRLVDRDDGRS
ncbi:MAG: plastocyanin/azurin family copper-binding protein [Actinomycetota bacterium]|nr:plastocyanin/azurin family copper-binding protein [Actinomycetota bacterium]